MKNKFLIGLCLVLFFAFVSCSNKSQTEQQTKEVKTDVYTCPMKCNNGQTYEKPGNCPVCGMELEKVTKS